jgi:hypothetical protein
MSRNKNTSKRTGIILLGSIRQERWHPNIGPRAKAAMLRSWGTIGAAPGVRRTLMARLTMAFVVVRCTPASQAAPSEVPDLSDDQRRTASG